MLPDSGSADIFVSLDHTVFEGEVIDLRERIELVSDLSENQNLLIESGYVVTYHKQAEELDLLRGKNDNLQRAITTLGSHIAKVAEACLEAFDKLTGNEK